MGAKRVSKQGVTVSQGNAIEVTNTAGTVLFSVDNTGNIGALPNLTAKGSILTASATSTPTTLAVGTNEQRLVADSATTSGLKYVADTTNYAIAAKGDLLVGTAADTVAALTAGSNGDTLVADSAASTGLRWQSNVSPLNPVINGAFDVWQRGTTITSVGTFVYSADRWQVVTDGVGTTAQVTRQTTSDSTNLPFIQYCARIARTTTGTNDIYFAQSFETINAIPYAGKTITLSFYARKGSGYSAASSQLIVKIDSGTGTDQNVLTGYTGGASPINSSATLTTTWQRFTFTGTVSATANEFGIYFKNTPVGSTTTNDYYEVTGVQIDVGNVALPFRRAGGTIQGEFAACSYYYYRLSGTNTQIGGFGTATTTTNARITVKLGAGKMRVSPTAIDYSNLAVGDGNNARINVTSATIGSTGAEEVAIDLAATGLTQYRPYALNIQPSVSGYLGLSAEL
jgi:hypothetical protein